LKNNFTTKSGVNDKVAIVGNVQSSYADTETCDVIFGTCGPGNGHMFQ